MRDCAMHSSQHDAMFPDHQPRARLDVPCISPRLSPSIENPRAFSTRSKIPTIFVQMNVADACMQRQFGISMLILVTSSALLQWWYESNWLREYTADTLEALEDLVEGVVGLGDFSTPKYIQPHLPPIYLYPGRRGAGLSFD